MIKYYVIATDFENKRLFLDKTGKTSKYIEETSSWEYSPRKEEIKKLYGKGWEYLTKIEIIKEVVYNNDIIRYTDKVFKGGKIGE